MMSLDYSNIDAAFLICWNLARDAVGITSMLLWGVLKEEHDASLTFSTPDHEVKISNKERSNQFFVIYLYGITCCLLLQSLCIDILVLSLLSFLQSHRDKDIENEILAPLT
jgi:hypothetical protein